MKKKTAADILGVVDKAARDVAATALDDELAQIVRQTRREVAREIVDYIETQANDTPLFGISEHVRKTYL